MKKLVLMKRANDDEANPWYAEFQKLITEREKDSEVAKDSYSWMKPPAAGRGN
jgi:hypothetical protein